VISRIQSAEVDKISTDSSSRGPCAIAELLVIVGGDATALAASSNMASAATCNIAH